MALVLAVGNQAQNPLQEACGIVHAAGILGLLHLEAQVIVTLRQQVFGLVQPLRQIGREVGLGVQRLKIGEALTIGFDAEEEFVFGTVALLPMAAGERQLVLGQGYCVAIAPRAVRAKSSSRAQ